MVYNFWLYCFLAVVFSLLSNKGMKKSLGILNVYLIYFHNINMPEMNTIFFMWKLGIWRKTIVNLHGANKTKKSISTHNYNNISLLYFYFPLFLGYTFLWNLTNYLAPFVRLGPLVFANNLKILESFHKCTALNFINFR